MNGKVSILRRGRSALDLTVCSPLKRIMIFMIPLFIGNLFQQLYSVVDTVIVGQGIGGAALAGVSSTGAISFLIMGFVSGLTHGFSVVTSQRRGAHDEEGVRKSFATGITLTVAIISVLTVVAVSVARPLLVAMHTLDELLPYSLDYITIIFGGMLLSAFYNQFSSTLRAIGDSVVPLYFLIFSSFLNGGLDCIFVLACGMGVRGAALATILSQGVSAVLTFVYMWVRYPMLRFKPKHFVPDAKEYGRHMRLGLPMAMQFSVISIGMIFGQTALNSMDNVKMNTAYSVASKIDGLACSAINSTGAAAATYVGQNYGARKFDRIKLGMQKLLTFSFLMSIGLGGVVLALHRPLVMLFIPKAERSAELYKYALTYLVFNASFYVLLASLCASRSALQGMGRGTLTLFAAGLEVVMRVVVSIIAINTHNFTVVCMCNCAAWLGANIILVPAFLCVLRRHVKLVRRKIRSVHMPDPSAVPYSDFVPRGAGRVQKRRVGMGQMRSV